MAIDPRTSRFWQETLRSGLLDEAALRDCWAAIPEEKREPEAIDRRLARQAVAAGHLTLWQAQQVLAGRAAVLKIGKYVVLDVIGRGGMGLVFLARDTRLRRLVAVKVLSRERMNSARAVVRFEREAKVGAQLQHDNLVRIYDEGEHRDMRFLVMEYIEGRNVSQILADLGRLPPPLAASIARQVALGLEHARLKGLIHRDVNPQNILVTYDGVAKLADLGLAIDLGDPDDVVTRDGATVGTFDYISPEQARHPRSVDTRSDLYSLGCTLYHMIAGRVPFQAASLPEKLYAHQLHEPEPLSGLVPGVPPGLEAIVLRMMAKAPADRFPTPIAVAEALAPFAEQAGALASILRDRPGAPAAGAGPGGPDAGPVAAEDRSDPNGIHLVTGPDSVGSAPTRTASALRPGPASALADHVRSDSDPGVAAGAAGAPLPSTEPDPESHRVAVAARGAPAAGPGLNLGIDFGPEPSLVEALGASRSRSRSSSSRSESGSKSTDRARRADGPPSASPGRRRLRMLGGLAVVAAISAAALGVLALTGGRGATPSDPGPTGGAPASTAPARDPAGPTGGPAPGAADEKSPAPRSPGFAVGPGDGSRLLPCDSFEAALAYAPSNGGTVFVAETGTPIRIGASATAFLVPGSSIVIRPYPGARPRLTVLLEGPEPWLRQRTGELTLEDLTVLVRYAGPAGSARPPLIESNGSLRLRRCTFSVQGGEGPESRAVFSNGLSTRLVGCLFRGFDRPIDLVANTGMAHELSNCVFVWPKGQEGARPGWAVRVAVRPSGMPGEARLTVDHCSVLRAAGLVEVTDLVADPPLAVRLAGSAIRADHLLCWSPPSEGDAFPSGLRWLGEGNRYDLQGVSWVVSSPDGLAAPPGSPADPDSWVAALGPLGRDDSSRATVSIADESAFESGTLTPARFAATSDGEPIGADPSQVGPPPPTPVVGDAAGR